MRVGIGGWTFAPWRGTFYPEGLVQRRELEYASRHLRVIEVNSTFYRAQKPAIYAKWAAETPAGFVFSMKAPRFITHRKKLADAGPATDKFVHGGLAEMDDRLGPILWQLPSSHPFDAGDLDAFLARLPRELNGQRLRHALEVRNPSFLSEDYLALARSHRVATVFSDSPDYPSLADITGDFTYARLMRSADDTPTGYAPAELDHWARHACDWAAGKDPAALPHITATRAKPKPRDVFVLFISAAKQRNPPAAMALQARVDA